MNLKAILQEKFGFEQFRPGQEAVIRDVLDGQDTIAILPTGMGKSLCYQFPAALMDGTTLIISPLVALMEDQVAIMKKNGEKRVAALNSFLSYQEKQQVLRNLPAYKFIFISPEMLVQKKIMQAFKRIQLSLIVIDEAHCISQWGFDFRPDYLRIGEVFHEHERPPILALTATANQKVVEDIHHYLKLSNPIIHRQSVDRPNISYSFVKVDREDEKLEWLKNHVKRTVGPGIIYVASRKKADEIASLLQMLDISIASYHAGKEQEDRAFIQEQFINGELQWICSTNAFGMGIHKDNIRQVIHAHIPQTMAGYIQEVGRAGRDGEQSAATLLFTPEDEGRTRFIMQEDLPTETEIRHYNHLLAENASPTEAAQLAGISETSMRIIEYYRERMVVDAVIQQINALIQEKETQLQKIIRFVHTRVCIRKEILAFFDERQQALQAVCCSNCHSLDDTWLAKTAEDSGKQALNWRERLALLL
ncbi:ATP-dependent DNA helicase RecQ [Sporosarcina sp. HYO08]|uniref:RecQ family ATP-dependent DNA helicase n=1 Tax=Sporosarcina sp. HYO08 TaxID=1759557 RepID=UPI00079128E7|nr:ATP-dependent DNA helicase RecQ [Sporosarcina sp. HYO08]KXH82043.1 hypothetical protein AU377_07265 [Sporosarcina sp. HYO08]